MEAEGAVSYVRGLASGHELLSVTINPGQGDGPLVFLAFGPTLERPECAKPF